MDDTRREFMRSVGLTVLGLLGARGVAGCRRDGTAASPQDVRPADGSGSSAEGPDAADAPAADAPAAEAAVQDMAVTSTDAAPPESGGGARDRVRACWLALLAWHPREGGPAATGDEGEAERDRRKAEHRAALDALVADGGVRAETADRMATAFDEATFHVWRSNSGWTCYRMTQLGGRLSEGRGKVLERLAALREQVDRGAVSDATVTDARAALERELLLFEQAEALEQVQGQERWETERRLVEQIDSGGVAPGVEELEAARVLVELLLAPPTP